MAKRQLVSVDAGNGWTTAATFSRSKHKTFDMASVRAKVSGGKIALDGIKTIEYEHIITWQGNRYVVGNEVFKLGASHIETSVGTRRYGSDFHQMLVAFSIAGLGIKSGIVDLAIYVPPAMHNHLKDTLKTAFSGDVSLDIEDTKSGKIKTHNWQYGDVFVVPEALAIAPALLLDDKAESVLSDALADNVAVVDLGVFTVDVLEFQNGSLNQDKLSRSSIENAGIHEHIRLPLWDYVQSIDADFRTVTIEMIDFVIRKGQLTNDYTLTVANKTIDLGDLAHDLIANYADFVANTVISTRLNNLNGYTHVILIGGGALLVGDFLASWYGEKIFDLSEHATTQNLSPLHINAVGGLRLIKRNKAS